MLDKIEIDPKTFLRNHCALPSLPEVLGKVHEIMGNDHIDFDQVAELVGSDPALGSQVLKIVNSAYYGLSKEISSIKFAIGFLGLNEIHRIMLSFAVVNTLAIEGRDDLVKDLWFHSFHTALCAVYLARKKDVRHIGEELWSAALLHDLGKLVYVKFFPEHFVALKTHMEENGCSCSTAETERDFPATAYLGTLLCDHWRLPLSVRAACEAHTLETLYEAEVSISLSETTRLVCVANLLSSLSMDTLNDDFKTEFGEAVKKALNYDEVRFANLMVEVEGLKADVDLFIRQFS